MNVYKIKHKDNANIEDIKVDKILAQSTVKNFISRSIGVRGHSFQSKCVFSFISIHTYMQKRHG